MADEEKKIIIDDDWKQEAQKEKEELAAEQESEKEKQAEAEAVKQGQQLPPADFTALVNMFATQAFFALGLIRTKEEEDKEKEPDLPMAKFNIDMIDIIEKKTDGNLEKEEKEMLDSTLHQLRMLFVQLSK
jgi:Pyruvate/2-oxoacid:ferredoxin oxidoreductase gamma subunit